MHLRARLQRRRCSACSVVYVRLLLLDCLFCCLRAIIAFRLLMLLVGGFGHECGLDFMVESLWSYTDNALCYCQACDECFVVYRAGGK